MAVSLCEFMAAPCQRLKQSGQRKSRQVFLQMDHDLGMIISVRGMTLPLLRAEADNRLSRKSHRRFFELDQPEESKGKEAGKAVFTLKRKK